MPLIFVEEVAANAKNKIIAAWCQAFRPRDLQIFTRSVYQCAPCHAERLIIVKKGMEPLIYISSGWSTASPCAKEFGFAVPCPRAAVALMRRR